MVILCGGVMRPKLQQYSQPTHSSHSGKLHQETSSSREEGDERVEREVFQD